MKIVFDANVLLAGIFASGLCEALLDATFGNGEHQLFTCDAILEEFARNAKAKFRLPPEKAAHAISILRQHLTMIVPAKVPANACRDKDDLPILGILVAAQADCLVTGDKDLLVLKQFDSRPILSPRECFELLARA